MNAHRVRVCHAGLIAVALGLATGCPAESAPPSQTATLPPPPSSVATAPRQTAPTPTADAGAESASRPKHVVVLLVVDQLPSWTFSRQLPYFHAGFARLAREGVYFPHAAYPYAATVTAVGHTALATGAPPRVSGIVGNSWFDRDNARWVDPTEDPTHLTVPPFAGKDDGTSPHFQMVDAVGAGKRVVSLSYKERAAVLMGGKKTNDSDNDGDVDANVLAVWYEPNEKAFVTSTYYASTAPTWLSQLEREHPIEPRLASYVWTPLETTPARALVPDAQPGETGRYGLGKTFPHKLAAVPKPEQALGTTPLASELLFELARAALDAEKPDLLCVSFSAHDLAAHAWGQESWEATDVLFRLDATIGELLDVLDARYGKDGWSLVLSSDHGGPPLVERSAKEGKQAVRVDVAVVQRAAEQAAKKVAGDGKWIAAADDRMLWLTPGARALPPETRSKLLDAVVAAAKSVPGMGFAYRADAFEKNADCTGLDELATLVCRSLYPDRSGDVYWGPRELSFLEEKPFDADVHGTPYDYDRQVPIIVREPGRAARVVEDRTPSVLSVAPTLARMLGKPPPPAAREPAL